jgi:hypothetical protein
MCQPQSDQASIRATFGTETGDTQLFTVESCILKNGSVARRANCIRFVVADIPPEAGVASDEVVNGAIGEANLLSRSTPARCD